MWPSRGGATRWPQRWRPSPRRKVRDGGDDGGGDGGGGGGGWWW
jgi:hypothetical protein